jgi:hypothetical protein
LCLVCYVLSLVRLVPILPRVWMMISYLMLDWWMRASQTQQGWWFTRLPLLLDFEVSSVFTWRLFLSGRLALGRLFIPATGTLPL